MVSVLGLFWCGGVVVFGILCSGFVVVGWLCAVAFGVLRDAVSLGRWMMVVTRGC